MDDSDNYGLMNATQKMRFSAEDSFSKYNKILNGSINFCAVEGAN